jgi:hypothetical protein
VCGREGQSLRFHADESSTRSVRVKQMAKRLARMPFGATQGKPFARAQGKPALQKKSQKHGSEDPPLLTACRRERSAFRERAPVAAGCALTRERSRAVLGRKSSAILLVLSTTLEERQCPCTSTNA